MRNLMIGRGKLIRRLYGYDCTKRYGIFETVDFIFEPKPRPSVSSETINMKTDNVYLTFSIKRQ